MIFGLAWSIFLVAGVEGRVPCGSAAKDTEKKKR
jgi:hypothetical protein